MNECGLLLGLFLVGELATATGHHPKELEKNQEKIIIKNEQRLQRMAEEPLQKAYQQRRKLRRQLAKLRD